MAGEAQYDDGSGLPACSPAPCIFTSVTHAKEAGNGGEEAACMQPSAGFTSTIHAEEDDHRVLHAADFIYTSTSSAMSAWLAYAI
jgi:hypothetical protein